MDLVIFDLDGTLIDSKQDLANAVNAARAHLGLPAISDELISTYVGNGAPVLIARALGNGASQADIQRALEYFTAYYHEHRLDYTRLYPGVREALDRMRENNVRLAVLTNKPVRISTAILDGLGVAGHFFRIYGGNSFEQKKPDPIGIETLRREASVPAARTLMVGDSGVDVLTARNAGVKVCGVRFGFQPEAFRDAPPDFLIDRMDELAAYVLARRGTVNG